MSDTKTDESPNALVNDTAVDLVEIPERPPYVRTLGFLFLGCCFLCLLNGQRFTNSLISIGFIATSALQWLPLTVSQRKNRRGLGIYFILGHLAVIIAFASGLPADYQRQRRFNNRLERRARAEKTVVDVGTGEPEALAPGVSRSTLLRRSLAS